MGGIERRLESPSRIGVHRFYQTEAVETPTLPLFTGNDLAEQQRITAALLLYAMKMGVSPEVIAIAGDTSPSDMHWIQQPEAERLAVAYSPHDWRSWSIEVTKRGIVAVSTTQDASMRMTAYCSAKRGRVISLSDNSLNTDDLIGWFKQCRDEADEHPVFGTTVPRKNITIFKGQQGNATIEFTLGRKRPQFDSPALFPSSMTYSSACTSLSYGDRGNSSRKQ